MEQDIQSIQAMQLLTETQAARLLACSVPALRRWRREARGPEWVRVERCVRYSARALANYLAENSSMKKEAADRESAAKREVRSAHATTRQT